MMGEVICMDVREFGIYLAKLRERRGYKSQRQLALDAGISPATLSRIEAGIQKPQPDTLRLISPYLHVSYEELMEKAGYLVAETSSRYDTDASNQVEASGRLREIPIVAEIPCGAPVLVEDNIIGSFPVDTSIVKLTGGDYVWVRAKGDSMIKAGIKDGSLVLIRLQPDVEDKDIAAVCVDQENATLKRIKFDEDNIILIPENDDMYPSSYAKERIRIVGKAVRVVAEL
jgi:repressor LexA